MKQNKDIRRVASDICGAAVCKDVEAALVEFDGEDDHLHLLVNYPPKVAISMLVNSLKGVSSRMIRKKIIRALPRSCGAAHFGRLAISRGVVAAHRLRLFGNILSSNKHRIERLRRSRLHPRPKRRGFTR